MTKNTFILLLGLVFLLGSPVIASANKAKQQLKILFQDAVTSYQKREYEKSIQLFEKTLKIKPDFAAAYTYIGLAKKETRATNAEVISYYRKAINADPSYGLAYENLSKTYYGMGNFEKAEKYGLLAVEKSPHLTSAHLSLGWVYLLGLSKAGKAIPYFETAIKREKNPMAHFGLGISYFMDNQRPFVLDMITQLKSMDEEKLAKQLESMMRSGRYTPPKIPRSLPQSKSAASTLVKNDFPELSPSENVPVRVSTHSPVLSPRQSNQPDNETSGADRIRALQGNLRKGSGY